MKPIWYFVGLILIIMGIIITLTGVYHYYVPTENPTELEQLHPSIWWGAIMLITGIVFYIKNKNITID